MAIRESFPTRDVLRRPRLRLIDLLIGGAIFVVLYGLLRVGLSVTHPFAPGQSQAAISTDPSELPYYALRSLTRMFIALGLLGRVHVRVRHRRGPIAPRRRRY